MDLIVIGAAAAGITIAVIYKTAKGANRPTKTAGRGPKRTTGTHGNIPKRSWFVQAYNSSGAPAVKSGDLRGATAELTGRAAGAVGRKTRRRWTIVKAAAERSHEQRRKRWQEPGAGPAPLGIRRLPKPEVKTVEPTAVTSPAKPAQPAAPGPEPPKTRHLKAVPDPTPKPSGAAVTATPEAPTTLASPEAPPDWALLTDRITNFMPEDDAALIAFMHGEAAAVVRYAEALEHARETCTNDVGLDPSAVAGFTTYSEHMSDAAARMAEAYQTFVAVYGEVQQLAANGVVMPHNGRWFSGSAS